jgi:hypothetical protein
MTAIIAAAWRDLNEIDFISRGVGRDLQKRAASDAWNNH